MTAFNPPQIDLPGSFKAVAVDNANVYIGGAWDFLILDNGRGLPIRGLASFSKSSGSVRTGFKPNPDLAVNGVVVSPGGAIYAGGQFTTLGGVTRNGAAALNKRGAVLPFNPNVQPIDAGHAVSGIVFNRFRNTVMLFGGFDTVSGKTHSNIVEVDAKTGHVTDWSGSASFGSVDAVVVDPATGVVYAGGGFFEAGGVRRVHTAAFDSTGNLAPIVVDGFGDPFQGLQFGVRTLQLVAPPSGSKILDFGGNVFTVNGGVSAGGGAVSVP